MWKCLNCGAMNEQEFCVACGTKRTENEQKPIEYVLQEQSPKAMDLNTSTPLEPTWSAPEEKAKGPVRTTSVAAKALIISLVVLLMISFSVVAFLIVTRPEEFKSTRKPSGEDTTQQTEEVAPEDEQQQAKEQPLYYADNAAFLQAARKGLRVPDRSDITWQVEEPYLWEGTGMRVASVSFYEKGVLVAMGDCDIRSGKPMRSIVTYTKPEKKTSGMNLKNVQYFTYRNFYGDFSVDVPTFLEEEASDSTAAYYVSADGSITMDINSWPAGDVFNNADELYDHVKSGIAYEIGYDRKKDNWFVISGEDSGVVYYQYHVFTTDGLECSFILTYPKALEKEFDDIVTHIYHSFVFE